MNDEKLHVGIIGCGLIGNKRAKVIKEDETSFFCCASDVVKKNAQSISANKVYDNWQEMLENTRIDAVVVATPNKYLKDIAISAARKKIHVLCEKPLGRSIEEAEAIMSACEENGVILKTGFNHRHHPAIFKAHQLVEGGTLGPVYFIRCIYGHGGRPGYEKEWRASKDICGGGELLDQGVHVVDLFRWFLGEFDEAYGYVPTFYWNMAVEDNAFALFRTPKEQVAQMHTSWTQWKNRFTFEVFGEAGYLIVEGLGGSYGIERLIVGKRPLSGQEYIGGVPDEEVMIFEGPDISWEMEWKEFTSAIREKRDPLGSGRDGLEAHRMIEAVYQSARENRPVRI